MNHAYDPDYDTSIQFEREISRCALNARLEESVAQIERVEGIPGERILDVLAERRAARKPRS